MIANSKLVSKFSEDLKLQGRAEATIIGYRKDIEQFLTFLEDHPKFSSHLINFRYVDTALVIEFLNILKERFGVAVKTISRKINSLNTFFKYLKKEGRIGKNFELKIMHPKAPLKVQRILTSFEYRAIRDTTRSNLKVYTILELLLQTGIRIGEVSRIKVEDLLLNPGGKSYLTIQAFESSKARTIELNQVIVEALSIYMERFYNPQISSNGYLFYTSSGKPIYIRNIRVFLDRYFKMAGVENATVNDIRNTFIVHQLEHGVRLHVLSEYVGHTKSTTTAKYKILMDEPPERTTSRLVML